MSDTENRSRKVTSFDVARRAGVSRAAVSRTFTPNASVSAETRAKVHEAAKHLGYRVNYLARSLTNQRSDFVGVVAAGLDNPFRNLQIEQISRALLARNFRPVLLPTDTEDQAEVIAQLLHYAVSGVLVTSDAPPTSLCEEFADNGVPIVLINKGDDIPLVDRVVSDDKAAGQIAAMQLIDGGARRPAVMGAAGVSYTARRRMEAFLARCKAMGVTADVLPIARNDYAHGFDGAGQLAGTNIDALFCINDYLACGVIDGLARARKSRGAPPLRIIGHDNIPQAGWGAYELTTILQPCDIQAEQAIDLLTSRMADPTMTARVEFTPVSLIKRKTA
ncbi:MAG: putative transcriptional regulator protein LacI family [Devosia sp.]|uniref:LacI family DNA-binding transcriptional regulator n=1 Tax=Devosia sp. TaxID=1871048 RepID=UPI00262DDECD|nr:LacI family DNA-binding transcriptional regulator [Devosia sp.]MDB5588770.1 putative transcriptional regulator protein LacI family [Devosia sp.]